MNKQKADSDPHQKFVTFLVESVYVSFTEKTAIHDQGDFIEIEKIDIFYQLADRGYIRNVAG